MFNKLSDAVVPSWARLLLVLALGAVVYVLGLLQGERCAGQQHLDYVAAQAERTVAIGKAQTKVVVQTEIKYRDRIQKIYLKGEVIEKQVPVFVTPADDAVYGVNVGFVRAYNAAWAGDDPGPASDVDRESAGIPLSEVAETDVFNATVCRAWREQALGLRQFYRQQQELLK